MSNVEIWAVCVLGYCGVFAVGLAVKAIVEHVKSKKRDDAADGRK